jgi:2-dehydro-3-deoxygalactonokinase
MSEQMTPDWIAVDWGTTHLRVWAMRGGTQLAHVQSDDGMAKLERDQFEGALLKLIEGWLGAGTTPVIACGMVGARQGWIEAPYTTVPAKPDQSQHVHPVCNDPRLHVRIIPGLKQASPADVMRGEETQIAGFLALNSGWDGVICLPGTHTKWAHVSAGEVVSFQTYLTGEQFKLLSTLSVLRHSVDTAGWDKPAFEEALGDSLSRPERISANLFNLRACDLLNGQTKEVARARLSGLLIGAELAAARPFWLGQQIAVVGANNLSQIYADALSAQGVPATVADGARMALAGLQAAYHLVRETA